MVCMPSPFQQLVADFRAYALRPRTLPDGTDPELERPIALARTKKGRALELANVAYIYADRKQYELALRRMREARSTSPRTIRQRAVDDMERCAEVAGALARAKARLRLLDPDLRPLPSIHDLPAQLFQED